MRELAGLFTLLTALLLLATVVNLICGCVPILAPPIAAVVCLTIAVGCILKYER